MNCPQNRSPRSSFCDRCCLRAIIGTLAMSGAMNALLFSQHARLDAVARDWARLSTAE